MTEAEWLACENPTAMLLSFGGNASHRKLRLLAVSAAWPIMARGRPDSHDLIEAACAGADGTLLPPALQATLERIRPLLNGPERFSEVRAFEVTEHTLTHAAGFALIANPFAAAIQMTSAAEQLEYRLMRMSDPHPPDWKVDEVRHRSRCQLASLIRDIFGNPFRPVEFVPVWRTETAVALARQMYESRDYSAMPILADALQDASCDSAEILDHCRVSEAHVRGCWVVDLVLGLQ